MSSRIPDDMEWLHAHDRQGNSVKNRPLSNREYQAMRESMKPRVPYTQSWRSLYIGAASSFLVLFLVLLFVWFVASS